MPESHDFRSVIEQAERAATAGDYMAAERFLRDAALQQEASLGPLHPDLANTLNNLGVVYETTDKPADAERCYRRAYAIAIAALERDHPFVATSEKNLRDFCDARGIPFEPPTPPPAFVPTPAPVDVVSVEPPREVQSTEPPLEVLEVLKVEPSREVQRAEAPRERPADVAPPVPAETIAPATVPQPVAASNALGLRAVVVVAAIAVGALVAARLWFNADRNVNVESTQVAPTPSPVESAAPSETIAVPPKAVTKSERVGEPVQSRRAAAPVSARSMVEDANLCRAFRDWRCTPASSPVNSGQLVFYTRIKSPTAMTVEYRWYRNDRLEKTRAVRVQPNQRSGFRSFSGTTVNRGDWRVELRTRDGSVLHEERFAVR